MNTDKNIKVVSLKLKKRFVKRFVLFSRKVYKKYPKWVAPIFSEQIKFILKGPFHEIGEIQLFMVYRDSKPVARVSAHINRKHDEYYNVKQGFFGFFEASDDQEAVDLIFEEAGKWLKTKGCATIIGPESFAIYDEIGTLIDSYQFSPVLLCSYNPPYYPKLIETNGFKKEIDWYAFYKSGYDPIPRILQRATARMKKQANLTLRCIDLKKWDSEVALVREMFENAWVENWGNLPFTDQQWMHLTKELKLIIKKELAYILEKNGKAIAFSISIPNAFEAIIKAKGRLFPFGIFKILLNLKHIQLVRTMVLGVLEEYRNRGYEMALIEEIIHQGSQLGYHAADCSLVVETNKRLIEGLNAIGATKYKTFRIYKKEI